MKKKPYKKVFVGWSDSKPAWFEGQIEFPIITKNAIYVNDKPYRITIEEIKEEVK